MNLNDYLNNLIFIGFLNAVIFDVFLIFSFDIFKMMITLMMCFQIFLSSGIGIEGFGVAVFKFMH